MVTNTETPLMGLHFYREIPKQKYYTPDGRTVYSIPNIHGTKDGNTRDANFDKGWLLQPPQIPKLQCPHCDRWHDTKAQITKCGTRRKALYAKCKKFGKKEVDAIDKSPISENLIALEAKVSQLEAMLKAVLEVKR